MSSQDSSSPSPSAAAPRKRNFVGWLVMLAVIGVGAFFGLRAYHASQTREVTDNAQISGNITPVSARVRGQVVEVKVKDNDQVKKGDVLFTLDGSDYQTRVSQAESALAAARNRLAQARLQVALSDRSTSAAVEEKRSSIDVSRQGVVSAGHAVAVAQAEAGRTESGISQAQAGVSQAQAGVKSAEAGLKQVQAEAKRLFDDRDRYRQLFSKREVSAQQFEAASSAAEQAQARVDAAVQQVEAARAAVDSARAVLANAQAARQVAAENVGRAQAAQGEANARVGEAQSRLREAEAQTLQASVARTSIEGFEAEVARTKAELEQAKLNLSYIKVVAPSDGRVTRKNVEPGQFVEVGLPALALVDEHDMWVVANFKETQMERMVVGQEATLAIDTYPGTPLKGKIESIQAGTGSVFSLLPPENASGSFVKVVQRIPVKITIAADEQKRVPLRPGMSVEATVWLQ